MSKAKDAGQKYLDKLLAKIPEDKRNAIKENLSTDELLESLGVDVLAKSDYTRLAQELSGEKAKYELAKSTLDTWAAEKTPIVLQAEAMAVEIETLKTKLAAGGTGDGEGKVDTSNFVSKAELAAKQKEFEATIGRMQNEQTILAGLMPTIVTKHFQTFGEVLNTEELFKHVRSVGIPLDRGGYDDYVKDRVKEREAKDVDRRIEAARKEGLEQGRMSADHPYPVGTTNGIPLFPKADEKNQFGVDAAVQMFNDMRREKTAS